MNRLAEDAKAKGYRKVVFAGQSFGAYGIVTASGAGAFDKVIAVAPASGGAVSDANPHKPGLMGRIRPMLAASKVPGVTFLFKDDDFYTVATQNEIATGRYANVYVEDRPAGFSGHGSAWLDAFEFVYGECLNRYLQSDASQFRCSKPALKRSDHRWMTTANHLRRGGAKPISAADAQSALIGNTIAGREGNETVNIFFSSNDRIVLEFRSGFD